MLKKGNAFCGAEKTLSANFTTKGAKEAVWELIKMSITKKIQTFAHDLKMENSHLESPLTTKYFEKCSRGMTFLSLRTGSRLRGAQ